jgi:hypothetical protein
MRESTEIAGSLRQLASRRNRCASSSSDSAAIRRDYVLPFGHIAQHDSVAHQPDPAIPVGAPHSVINSIAIAHIETGLAAVPPDGVLNEPGKGLRERGIELPGIDVLGNGLNNICASAWPVAGCTVGVFCFKPMQDAVRCRKL